MLICPKCKKIYNDEANLCPKCRKKLKEIKDKNTPVAVCGASGVDRARIKASLSDAGIPSDEVIIKNYSVEAVTGNDIKDVNIVVPYQAYQKAYDICVGIGAINPDEGEIPQDIKDDINSKKSSLDTDMDDFEEMTPTKRTAVRIISAILLIIVFCGVIWGADYILEIIKGLF
jgi:hypothetical protein